MLEAGDILLVCYRRLFANDDNRFFLGKVDAYDTGIVKLTGHSFLRDAVRGEMTEKSSLTTKLLSVSSGTLIIYQIPTHVELAKLRFEHKLTKLSLVDDAGFMLDLSEKMFHQS